MGPTGDGELVQHLVSQVLLRRWAENHKVRAYDMVTASAKLVAPARTAFVLGLTKVDAKAHEDRWGKIETPMPRVFASIDNGTFFDDERQWNRLRDFAALQYARSLTFIDAYEQSLSKVRSNIATDPDLRDPDTLSSLFLARHRLHAAGPEALRIAHRDATELIVDHVARGSEFFAEALQDAFGTMRERLAGYEIQLGRVPDETELLLGDNPNLTFDADTSRVGTTLDRADAVVLPLGPKVVFTPAKTGGWFNIPATAVDRMNSIQLMGVHQHVYLRPGSTLEPFVTRWRTDELARD
jgi:hypothetical protein